MKVIEQLYQETEIHFALQNDGHVMVNATEMAKAFGKRTDVFLKTAPTKKFIKALEKELKLPPTGGSLVEKRGRNGIYFERRLALKFAAWLDTDFEVWIFTKMDELLFGNYKKHYDATVRQKQLEVEINDLKCQMLEAPTPELVASYFSKLEEMHQCANIKRKAIKDQNQLDLFKNQ